MVTEEKTLVLEGFRRPFRRTFSQPQKGSDKLSDLEHTGVSSNLGQPRTHWWIIYPIRPGIPWDPPGGAGEFCCHHDPDQYKRRTTAEWTVVPMFDGLTAPALQSFLIMSLCDFKTKI